MKRVKERSLRLKLPLAPRAKPRWRMSTALQLSRWSRRCRETSKRSLSKRGALHSTKIACVSVSLFHLLVAISGGSGRGLPRCWANLWIVGFPLRWANLYSTGFHGAGIAQYQPPCRLMVDRLRAAVSLPKRATAAAVTSSASLILSAEEKVSFGLRDLKWHSWAWEKYRVVMRTWNIILV